MKLNDNLQNAGAGFLNAKTFEVYVGIFFSLVCLGIFLAALSHLWYVDLPMMMNTFNM